MPTVLSGNLSRWQVACISLPVEHASGFRLVNVPLSACSDPDRSPMRIPEHVIIKAIQYLQMSSGKHNAVEVKGIGIFNVNGLRRMRFFVEAAATKRNISEEEQWFSKFSWSMTEQIREVLWDNPSNYILGNIGGTAVSPRLLSTISCERSMSDDAVFVAMTAVLGVSTVLLLPAITYEYASGSSSYSVLSETCRQAVQRMVGSVVFIAQIVHLPGHWTVAIVNRQDGRLFFGNTAVKSYKCPTDLPARMARIVKVWAFSFYFCIAYPYSFFLPCLFFSACLF